jgi:hypothetical protein
MFMREKTDGGGQREADSTCLKFQHLGRSPTTAEGMHGCTQQQIVIGKRLQV